VLKAAHVFTRKIPLEFDRLTKERLLADIAKRMRVRKRLRAVRSSGKVASEHFSSCKQTTSGFEAFSQSNRFGSLRLMLLILNVAIFIRRSSLLESAATADLRDRIDARSEHLIHKTQLPGDLNFQSGRARLSAVLRQKLSFRDLTAVVQRSEARHI
jgi:hypothetical protein